MPRIRTIKPEFPQSESMGRVSREARLLFILLWTQSDDEGRLRGHSRMLASTLFPYDDDALNLIDGWIEELRAENCIERYTASDGATYIAICHWNAHQKIDKPSKSKLPAPDSATSREDSRALAKCIEPSIPSRARADLDQGSRKGPGKGQGTREREEENGTGCATDSPSLSPLMSDSEFKQCWDRWERHRINKHKPIGEVEAEQQLIELGRHGIDEAKAMVNYSISRGALNLITNGDHRPKPPPSEESAAGTRGASLYDALGAGETL